jgi:hypothetical protein
MATTPLEYVNVPLCRSLLICDLPHAFLFMTHCCTWQLDFVVSSSFGLRVDRHPRRGSGMLETRDLLTGRLLREFLMEVRTFVCGDCVVTTFFVCVCVFVPFSDPAVGPC